MGGAVQPVLSMERGTLNGDDDDDDDVPWYGRNLAKNSAI